MTWLARAIAEVLRRSAPLMPADRRQWAEAVLAEIAEVPVRQRLSWLAGGLRLTIRQVILGGRLRFALAFTAATAGVAWSAWSGPSGDSAIAINRVDVIAMAVILAGLPCAVGWARGPVAGCWPTRLMRGGGYVAILALILAKSAVERVADAPPNNSAGPVVAWVGEAVFLAVMASYAAMILVFTARRSPVASATVGIGAAGGAAIGVLVYALGPLGFPLRFAGASPTRLYDAAMALGVLLALCAPIAAGRAAARRADRSLLPGSRARQGALAGLCTGTAAALAVAAMSTATIALLPYITGLRNWASGHVGQWTPAVGQVTPTLGPRLGYVAGNSAFAAGYLIVLLVSPLAGCALGGWAAFGFRTGPAVGLRTVAAKILRNPRLTRGPRPTTRQEPS
jgi:hypothetical protein